MATDRPLRLERMLPVLALGPGYRVEVIAALSDLPTPDPVDPFLLLVDLESFGGVDPVVDVLIPFRLGHPTVPVIIVSETFHRSEASAERRFVCDVSLRIPCQITALAESLATACPPSPGPSF